MTGQAEKKPNPSSDIPTPGAATSASEVISSAEPRVPFRLFALKHGDTFMVADANGDVLGEGDGLFRDDTRVLSFYRLTLGGRPPSLLGAAVSQDNVLFTSNLTNRPLPPLGGHSTPEGVIHIERQRLIFETRLYERISLVNYAQLEAEVPLEITFKADFRDMFEVRGKHRTMRGVNLSAEGSQQSVELRYRGLDSIVRTSVIAFSHMPVRLDQDHAEFQFYLKQSGRLELFIEAGPDMADLPSLERYRRAVARARFGMRAERRRGATMRSSGRLFNDWVDKSRADLALLTTDLATGPYPYAGIPWFSTPFGRDAIVTAMQMLWLDPSLARGVLAFLSRHQAIEKSAFQDSAPGKIMHETRKGEMAALRELPFGQYYGGVDTTPLFVMLAGAYAERTADLAFIGEIWPALRAAVAWMEGDGDSNGDGLIDYQRAADTGLANQGWKDSNDSVFHADGRDPIGPIALVEVQGYVFAALRAIATLAERRGEPDAAAHWRAAAEKLRAEVEARFWMEDLGYYALALDGSGSQCRVRTSNAGHLLFTGLPAPDRAAKVIGQLLSPPLNAGWGIRTLATEAARFNPMSYHNGSIWPHDTAICAAGIARYGDTDGIVRLISEVFEAAVRFDMRLPELFCGFQRRAGEAPIAYPVACLPQAWSSGSLFMILQSCLGLTIDGWNGAIRIEHPRLPIGIDRLTINRLTVNGEGVDLTFQRVGDRIAVYRDQAAGAVPVMIRA